MPNPVKVPTKPKMYGGLYACSAQEQSIEVENLVTLSIYHALWQSAYDVPAVEDRHARFHNFKN